MNDLTVPSWDGAPTVFNWAEKIAYLAHKFQSFEQTSCPVEHLFAPGWYIRRMRIPAGTLFLGRKHNHGHAVVLVEGSAILITPQGKVRYDAPNAIETEAGFHAVAFILTDVVAETWHLNPGDGRDVDAHELDIFEPAAVLFERGRQLEEKLLCLA
jgi:hypothetical protein